MDVQFEYSRQLLSRDHSSGIYIYMYIYVSLYIDYHEKYIYISRDNLNINISTLLMQLHLEKFTSMAYYA